VKRQTERLDDLPGDERQLTLPEEVKREV